MKKINNGHYKYKGYDIKNLGYHEADKSFWWEAVNEITNEADYHAHTKKDIKKQIDEDEVEIELTEEEEIAEENACGYFTAYLLYKYEFLQSDIFRDCKNKKLCSEDNLHFCGCFKQYLYERNQLTIMELKKLDE